MRLYALFLLWIITFAASQLDAQYGKEVKLYPELSATIGYNHPMGSFADTSYNPRANKGNATSGFFLEVLGEHRVKRFPAWSFGVKLGFLLNGFQDGSMDSLGYKANYTGKAWTGIYVLPMTGLEFGRRFKYGFNLAGGILSLNGWDVDRIYQTPIAGNNIVEARKTWNFDWTNIVVLQPGIKLAYRLTPEWTATFNAQYLFGSGDHIGDYAFETVTQTPTQARRDIRPGRVRHPMNIQVLQIGVGVRYVFYNWKK